MEVIHFSWNSSADQHDFKWLIDFFSGTNVFMSASWMQLCTFFMDKRQNAAWDFYVFQDPWKLTYFCRYKFVIDPKWWRKEKKWWGEEKKRERITETTQEKKTTKEKNAGDKRTINSFLCCSSSCICEQLSQLLVKLYLTFCQHEFSKKPNVNKLCKCFLIYQASNYLLCLGLILLSVQLCSL